MRIWDISPSNLCRQHLLGEHRELHAMWTILTTGKKGYANHPETIRWIGKLKAMLLRHEALVIEMGKRGYHHYSPLDPELSTGSDKQDMFINTIEEQWQILKQKGCECKEPIFL